MIEFALDPAKTRIRVRTFAEGLFSRLAHDLELTCTKLAGHASGTDNANASATLEIPLSGIVVAGVLHGDHVDEGGLSRSDREDVLAKMQKDVFHAGASAVVRVEATTLPDGSARVRIVPPNGKTVEQKVRPDVKEADGGVHVEGRLDVSLSALGSSTVKGPMNAFRVKDRVEILYDVAFAPPQPA